jgi:hypothetical protein
MNGGSIVKKIKGDEIAGETSPQKDFSPLFQLAGVLVRFDQGFPHHRKRESRYHVTGCKTLRSPCAGGGIGSHWRIGRALRCVPQPCCLKKEREHKAHPLALYYVKQRSIY